jgi:hypothetical protein
MQAPHAQDPVYAALCDFERFNDPYAADVAVLVAVVSANPASMFSACDTLCECAPRMRVPEVVATMTNAAADPRYLLLNDGGPIDVFFSMFELAKDDVDRQLQHVLNLDIVWRDMLLRIKNPDEDIPTLWRLIGNAPLSHHTAYAHIAALPPSWDMCYAVCTAPPSYSDI